MLTATQHRNTVPVIPRDGLLPTSFAQEERLVAGRHSQVTNNIVTAGLELDGPLDTRALEEAIVLVTGRHEALRIVFPEESGGSCLGLLPEIPEPLSVLDVTDLPTGQRSAAALLLLAEAALRPVDLAQGPLFRATLVRVGDSAHVLGIAIDQYLVDRWAMSLVLDEILATYSATAHGTRPELARQRIQFPDYAAWERTHLTGGNLERLLGYWRRKLAGIDPIPASGLTDPGAPVAGPVALARVTATLDRDRVAALNTVAENNGTSLVVVFSAATKAATFRRRAGADAVDVAVFGSLANRVLPDTEKLVGYLATPTVLRTDLSGDPTFGEVVSREARTFWEAMWHQKIPHALITKELAPEQYGIRHRGGATEIPRYLNFDLADDRTARLPQPAGLVVRACRIPMPEVPRGGLRVIVHRHVDTATVELRFRTDCYREEWARSFVADVCSYLTLGARSTNGRLSRAFDA